MTTPLITRDETLMRDITSFEDAIHVLQAAGVTPVNFADEYGDGFELCKGKDAKATLVGVPFVILGIKMIEGDFEDKGTKSLYAVIHLVTKDGRKLILLDGGTGVCATAQSMLERGHDAGIYVESGLRRSDYEFIDEKGNKSPATTFYFSN